VTTEEAETVGVGPALLERLCPDGSQFQWACGARTAVVRGASCGSSASVVGTDADPAAVVACLGETSSRHSMPGVHDAALRRWVLVSAVRAARRSRLATACAALARKCLRHG